MHPPLLRVAIFKTTLKLMLKSILLFAFTGILNATEPTVEPPVKPSVIARTPNVVLIVADDMGYGDASCYGATDIRTPNLDRLAEQGTKFTNFNVAQAVCTASRAGLVTGCYPNRIGMSGAFNHTSTTGMHADENLLSEVCKSKGYATACFGKWHLGTRPAFDPLRHGFDQWLGLPYSNDNGPLHPTVRGIPALPLIENGKTIELDPDQSTFTNRFTGAAVQFIGANKSQPFLLYVPHVMPHVPIAASANFRGKSNRGLYGDAVEEVDWSVGRILDALAEHGLDSNTLVLFLSDNGPFLSYGNHAGSAGPFREGKLTAFEGGVRVPFLARWPEKVPAGRTCDELITGIDLLPTLAALIGATLPDRKIDGLDLAPLLMGAEGAKGRSTFAYYSGAELHAVRRANWKLHLPHDYLTVNGPPGVGGRPANYANMKPNAIEESGVRGIASRHGYMVAKLELSLFDLASDPGERTDVAGQHPEVVAELTALAAEFRADLGDSITQQAGSGLRPIGTE